MSTESRKCATESVQREFTTRRGDWDRLAGCLSLGLVGWLNNLLRSLVKNQVASVRVSKVSCTFIEFEQFGA